MATYLITRASGATEEISVPDTIPEDQVNAYILQQDQSRAQTPSTSNILEEFEYAPDRGFWDELGVGVERGLGQVGSLLGDTAPALFYSAIGDEEAAMEQLKEAEESQAKLRPRSVGSYKDVDSAKSALQYAAGTFGEALPTLATSIIPGLGFGTVGAHVVGKAVASRAARKVVNDALKKAAGKELSPDVSERALEAAAKRLGEVKRPLAKWGGLGGASLGSFALNAPEVFQNIYEATGDLTPGTALLAGGVNAALDTVLPLAIVRRAQREPLFRLGLIKKTLEKSKAKPSVIKALSADMAKVAGIEGVTEATQEYVSIAAEQIVGGNWGAINSEESDRLIESFIAGALVGTPFGAVSGASKAATRKKHYARDQQKKERQRQRQEAAEEQARIEKDNAADIAAVGRNIVALTGKSEPDTKAIAEEEAFLEFLKRDKAVKGGLDDKRQKHEQNKAEEERLKTLTDATTVDDIVNTLPKQDRKGFEESLKKELSPSELVGVSEADHQASVFNLGNQSRAEAVAAALGKIAENTENAKFSNFAKEILNRNQRLKNTPTATAAQAQAADQTAPAPETTDQTVTSEARSEVDPLYDEAVRIVTESRNGSISGVQRRLKIGYNRAARMIEHMEAVGLVGPLQSNGAREVIAPAPAPTAPAPAPATAGLTPAQRIELEAAALSVLNETGLTESAIVNARKSREELIREVGDSSQQISDAAFKFTNTSEGERQARLRTDIVGGVKTVLTGIEALGPEPKLSTDAIKTAETAIANAKSLFPEVDMFSGVGNFGAGNRLIRNLLATPPAAPTERFSSPSPSGANVALIDGLPNTTSSEVRDQVTDAYGGNANKFINKVNKIKTGAPPWGDSVANGVRQAVSKLPTISAKVAFYNLLGFRQLADVIKSTNATLSNLLILLDEAVNRRRKRLEDLRLDVENNLVAFKRVENRYRGASVNGVPVMDAWNNLVHEASAHQVDLRNLENLPGGKNYTNLNTDQQAIAKAFQNLTKDRPDLAGLFEDIVDAYEAYLGLYLDAISNAAGDGVLTTQIKSALGINRPQIVPYLPFLRDGQFWLDYKLPQDSEISTEAFNTKHEWTQARKELIRAGATEISSEPYMRPPLGYSPGAGSVQLAEIIKVLEENNVNKDVTDQIKGTILNMFPADSLKQQFRKRKGIKGYNKDAVQNFATQAYKMANEIGILETHRQLEDSAGAILPNPKEADGGLRGAQVAVSDYPVLKSVSERLPFLRNPTPGRLAGTMSYMGYVWYILGNASSVLVNATQLPIVAYGILSGRYGAAATTAAMKEAFSGYFSKGGWDNNTNLRLFSSDSDASWAKGIGLKDRTMFPMVDENIATLLKTDPNKLTPKEKRKIANISKEEKNYILSHARGGKNYIGDELAYVYQKALEKGAVRRATGQELQDIRKNRVNTLTGRLMKAQYAASWAFSNSERLTREMTFYASYKLAKQKAIKAKGGGKLTQKEMDRVIDTAVGHVDMINGASLAEAGPKYFHQGIGKVIGTFKRFALSQVYLQGRLAAEALGMKGMKNDPVARKIAAKQLFSVAASAWFFAGLRGIPLYGAVELFGNMLLGILGDEEDTVELWIRDAAGDVGFNGIASHLFGVDIAQRTGFYGALYQDDPYLRAKMGPFWGSLMPVLGPWVGMIQSWERAGWWANQGDYARAIESGTPSVIRNAMRGFRFLTEGALDSKGVPIVKDISAYGAMMQILGLTPKDLAAIYTFRENVKRKERNNDERVRRLYDEYYAARVSGDYRRVREIVEEGRKYGKTLGNFKQSYTMRKRHSLEAVGGLKPSEELKGLLKDAESMFGVPEEELLNRFVWNR